MNKAILLGRLGKDPIARVSQNGTMVASFSLAVNRKYKRDNEPDSDWFSCSCFGKQAEFVDKYLKQGIKVLVTGRIQNDNYTNKDGQKVYSTKIIVEEIEFGESKKETEEKPQDGFMNVSDTDMDILPFN